MDDYKDPYNRNHDSEEPAGESGSDVQQPDAGSQPSGAVEGETFTMYSGAGDGGEQSAPAGEAASWENTPKDAPAGETAASSGGANAESFPREDASYTNGAQQSGGYQNAYGQTPPYNQYNGYAQPGAGYGGYQGYSTGGSAPQSPFAANPPKTGTSDWVFPDYDQPGNFGKAPKPQKPKKNKGLVIFSVILSVVFVLTVGCFAGYAIYTGGGLDTAKNSSNESKNADAPELKLESVPSAGKSDTTSNGKMTIPAIAKKVRPSVVGIVVYTQAQSIENLGQASSEGSGIILDDKGYIVTNAHVVNGAASIKVVLANEEEYEAKLVGLDTKTDLAVIKIDAKNLSPATLGDSSQVEVGETVLAIGNPSGLTLAGSVTQGIVSATNRMVKDSSTGYNMTCLQTDAAINPGNSGGALVNEYGQVIGINSSKIAATEYEGIGFAIPTNEALPIINSLTKYGYVKDRARIGISYQQIDEIYAKLQNVPAGLFVVAVDQTTDAYKKGVRVNDIITKIDGKAVNDSETVNDLLKSKKPGDTVRLTIYRINSTTRKSSTFELTVKLEEDRGQTNTTQQQQQQQQQQQNPFGY